MDINLKKRIDNQYSLNWIVSCAAISANTTSERRSAMLGSTRHSVVVGSAHFCGFSQLTEMRGIADI